MKKIIPFLLIALMMTACSKDETGYIEKYEFSNSEKKLLNNLGYAEDSVVRLDLNLSKLEAEEVTTVIEYYKNGEFVKEILKSSKYDRDNGTFEKEEIVWSRRPFGGEDEELWVLGSNSRSRDNSSSSSRTLIVRPPKNTSIQYMSVNENFKGEMEKNKKYPLAIYSLKSEDSFMTSDIDFDDMDSTMENLKDYDGVYILYVEIK